MAYKRKITVNSGFKFEETVDEIYFIEKVYNPIIKIVSELKKKEKLTKFTGFYKSHL